MIKFAAGCVVGFGIATGALYGWMQYAETAIVSAGAKQVESQALKQLKLP